MKDQILAEKAEPAVWPRPLKAIVSLLVGLHLVAVFIAPMAFASRTEEVSPAVVPVMTIFRPYVNAMFLNHGYAFFAPDPPPASHLVESTLTFADGRPSEKTRFPDLKKNYPRLMYHRHFMLSESLNTMYIEPTTSFPPNTPEKDRAAAFKAWAEQRHQFNLLRDSYARHVAYETGAKQVEIHRIAHEVLPYYQFTREVDPKLPTTLTDPRTYVDLDAVRTPPPLLPMPRQPDAPRYGPLRSGVP